MARLTRIARVLRKNMTAEELKVWHSISRRQLHNTKFRRQAPIGPYIVDFASFETKIVIEIDGSGHGETIRADATRDAWLRDHGFAVFRFTNDDVHRNLDGILSTLWDAIDASGTTIG